MSIRQVYVIWTHPLFHESIRLLLKHPDIQFVGADSDYAAAQDEISHLRPNTILIEDVGEGETNQAMNVLKSCPWNVIVILISLTDNQLNLYHHEQRTVGQTEDLLQLVLQ
jgi:DNA-binding NarL/FixJ family response regulator